MASVFIKSSNPELCYKVSVNGDRDSLNIICDCPAGSMGQWCKHKTAIVKRDSVMLFNSKDTPMLNELSESIEGSEIVQTFQELDGVDKEISELKKKQKGLKQKIARLARG